MKGAHEDALKDAPRNVENVFRFSTLKIVPKGALMGVLKETPKDALRLPRDELLRDT